VWNNSIYLYMLALTPTTYDTQNTFRTCTICVFSSARTRGFAAEPCRGTSVPQTPSKIGPPMSKNPPPKTAPSQFRLSSVCNAGTSYTHYIGCEENIAKIVVVYKIKVVNSSLLTTELYLKSYISQTVQDMATVTNRLTTLWTHNPYPNPDYCPTVLSGQWTACITCDVETVLYVRLSWITKIMLKEETGCSAAFATTWPTVCGQNYALATANCLFSC